MASKSLKCYRLISCTRFSLHCLVWVLLISNTCTRSEKFSFNKALNFFYVFSFEKDRAYYTIAQPIQTSCDQINFFKSYINILDCQWGEYIFILSRPATALYLSLYLACANERYTYKDVQQLFNSKYSKLKAYAYYSILNSIY